MRLGKLAPRASRPASLERLDLFAHAGDGNQGVERPMRAKQALLSGGGRKFLQQFFQPKTQPLMPTSPGTCADSAGRTSIVIRQPSKIRRA